MEKRMGEELLEAMQELLDYSDGKIDLVTTRVVPDTIVAEKVELLQQSS